MRDVKDKQSWEEQDSIEFIQDGAVFVPDREEQIDLMADLIPPTHAGGHVVELCCGEGLLSREILRRHPNIIVHGYDGSPRMLAKAKDTVGEFRDRFDDRLFDLAKPDWRAFPWGVLLSSRRSRSIIWIGMAKRLCSRVCEPHCCPAAC
jgi:tRNA (cmo5U34)-methyltransferase